MNIEDLNEEQRKQLNDELKIMNLVTEIAPIANHLYNDINKGTILDTEISKSISGCLHVGIVVLMDEINKTQALAGKYMQDFLNKIEKDKDKDDDVTSRDDDTSSTV